MKIVCPSCEAAYEVPEVVMTSRRKMRCARCGTEWVPADAGKVAAAEAVAEPAFGAARFEQAGHEPAMPVAPVAAAGLNPSLVHENLAPESLAHGRQEERPAEPQYEAAPRPQDAPGPELPVAEAPGAGAELQSRAAPDLGLAVLVPPEPVLENHPVVLRPETPVPVVPSADSQPAVSPVTKQVPPAAPGPPLLAWGASIGVVVIGLAAGVVFRAPIMKAWPPSQRLYAGLGLVER
jgi:predicted Zn finger-like uncharacterized protein